mmetsp:Transcript_12723/g.35808  ORF Transcript_12723/g.35808 Transcript_12723/m.35808 type:complete len:87 (+) Transcript_12723:247-507(+)
MWQAGVADGWRQLERLKAQETSHGATTPRPRGTRGLTPRAPGLKADRRPLRNSRTNSRQPLRLLDILLLFWANIAMLALARCSSAS